MTQHRLIQASSLACISLFLASCASQPTAERPTIKVVQGGSVAPVAQPSSVATRPVVHNTQPAPAIQTQPASTTKERAYANFDDWRYDFIQRAINRGLDEQTVRHMMAQANLNQRVISLDRNQAEFSKMPWEYVESAASSARINQGKAKLNAHLSMLNQAQTLYGIPKEIVVAIWGVESSFGAGMGTMDLVSALSSLAYDGRRREFAEQQLIAMAKMVQQADVTVSQLKGSWAGGMGHTQFIPSTWLEQGVDGDQDHHKNPWSISDSLNSTASYLANAGWVRDLPPYYEVKLPENFDYTVINSGKRSLDAWRKLGVVSMEASQLTGANQAELWLPAGKYGPALLLTKNFDAIRVYNNSSSYALAVSLLAKRIAGEQGLVATWPKHEQPLSRIQVQNLQRNLTALGFDTGGVDGVVGSNTRRAFAEWQFLNGKTPDGFISQATAAELIW